jgi:hypothetical protein
MKEVVIKSVCVCLPHSFIICMGTELSVFPREIVIARNYFV